MRQVCLVAYPRLIQLIEIKRCGGIDYLKTIFNNSTFITLGQEVGKSTKRSPINDGIAMEPIDGTRSKWTKVKRNILTYLRVAS